MEDQSGKQALDLLLPKMIGTTHTFRVIPYRGIGRIPKGMRDTADASKRALLSNLPKLLRGYGRSFSGRQGYAAAVILVCDLDDRCLRMLRQELDRVLDSCHPKPETRFCVAVEEGEAWLLGDLQAVDKAYPTAKKHVLNSYENDSICGTWEVMANALFPGGAKALAAKGWQAVGTEKSNWARNISPHLTVEQNQSPSFQYFRTKLLELAGDSAGN